MKTLKLLLLLLTSTMYGQYAENFNSANSFSQSQPLYVGSTCTLENPPTPSNNPTNGVVNASGGSAIRIDDFYDNVQLDEVLKINGINTLNTNTISFNVNWVLPTAGQRTVQPLKIQYSINNGITYLPLTYPLITQFTNNKWNNVTLTLPSNAKVLSLYLKFEPNNALSTTGNSAPVRIYVDDIKTDNVLSNEEFQIKPHIYSNHNYLTIQMLGQFKVEIYNLNGQLMYSNYIIDEVNIDMKSSIYIVNLTIDNVNFKKIIYHQ